MTRVAAVDWLRGLVMMLMALDHASSGFNGGRFLADAWFMDTTGGELPPEQFLTRWVTHLCAPTFVFLAGTSLALNVSRRRASGESEGRIDLALAGRGAWIVLLDLIWITPVLAIVFASTGQKVQVIPQVLYAIGAGMIVLAFARRLPAWLLGAAGLAIAALHERWSLPLMQGLDSDWPQSGVATLFLVPGYLWGHGSSTLPCFVLYPLLLWLAMMLLGWWFGAALLRRDEPRAEYRLSLEAKLSLWGLASIAVFLFVRDVSRLIDWQELGNPLHGYGNMGLHPAPEGLLAWLHVSKYPPSLAFTALELGLMALILAALLRWERSLPGAPRRDNPFLVFGQTALFFYLVHFPLLELGAVALGRHGEDGIGAAFLAATVALLLLYPACRWYRDHRTRKASLLTRLI